MKTNDTMMPRQIFSPDVRKTGGGRMWLPFTISSEMFAGIATLALASVSLIGPLGVMLFISCSLALIATQPLANLRELIRFLPLLSLPLLAIISTMWSDAPQHTMRASLELLITFVAAVVVCRNMRPERFLLALFIAFTITALTVLPSIPSSFVNKWPLGVWWGSKNSVGFTGYMLFALSLGVFFDFSQMRQVRIFAVFASIYALFIAYLSQSGGTTAAIVIVLLIFPPLLMMKLFNYPMRITLAVSALLLALIAAFFLSDITAAIANFRTNVLNKDATLTGRTYLWDFAARVSAERPVLGHGYFAFWRQGNIDAEGLWRWGGIASRSGFNFHNAFVAIRVDLGMVGLVILILSCVVITSTALIRQVMAPSAATACLVAIMTVNYVRSYVEEGLVAPFSFISMIWLSTLLFSIPMTKRQGPLPGRSHKGLGYGSGPAAISLRQPRWWSGSLREHKAARTPRQRV